MKEKSELIRIVKRDGGAEIDPAGKSEGRGAYICRNTECAELAKKRRSLSKHFKMPVEERVYDAVLEMIESERG